jgi:hypothetical protein
MSENGICSTDETIGDLRNKVSEAEDEISMALAKLLPHIRVEGVGVSYSFGTSRGVLNSPVHVTLSYRII